MTGGAAELPERPRRAGWLGAPLFLVVGLGAPLFALRQPEPVAAQAETQQGRFVGERALQRVERIARAPRPHGSEAHDEVFHELVRELRLVNASPMPQVEGELRNLIARVEGRDPTGTVLFVCHYDSRAETPGAADDGAAVACMLELVRGLTPPAAPPRNDLLFLFTDAEENGLLGARAFVENAPELAEVSVVLNFDAIGNDGSLVMFETGPESGALVQAWGRADRQPIATSFATFVYERMPNDTDFTPFERAGLRGLNFAICGGGSAYHEPFDTPANLSPGSVQLVGDTMTTLARTLGEADLASLPRDERVFFDVLGIGLVSFGAGTAQVVLGVAVALLLVALVRAARRRDLNLARCGLAILRYLSNAVVFVVLLVTAWFSFDQVGRTLARALGVSHEPRGNRDSAELTLVGLSVLAFVFWSRLAASRWNGPRGETLTVGGFLAWLLVLGFLAAQGPYVAAQLPLAAAVVAAGALFPHSRGVVAGTGAIGVALLAPHLALTFHLLSKNMQSSVMVLAFGVAVGAGLFTPWLALSRLRRPALVLLALVGAGLVVGGGALSAAGR